MTNPQTSQAQWPSTRSERPVHLLFFGALAESLGRSGDLQVPSGGCTVAALRKLIATRFVDAGGVLEDPGVRIALNQQPVDEHAWVCSGDEVSFAGPLPGA
jgi:molybdopterin converting factor small subunit